MKQNLLGPSPLAPLSTAPQPTVELAEIDLIFVQDLGLVPKRLVTLSRPATPPNAQRKWLGADFSHVIVSQ
ncbi:hypothetical protein [Hymenobacter cheonanensis]|uniref:hypothetical protein n=1 Tax=Hymenobacter sp. CA2-7 TaxID=3063993 RepID=UPI002712CAB4|nr:hypothetical protein [Hymenobacter sp. CA2-7]MDO7887164.1 hypothetical protein [Hymenobacter sp. CA2-7]